VGRIKNIEQLIENGQTMELRKARSIALTILDNALTAVDPKSIMESKISLRNFTLNVEGYQYQLANYNHIYVVGAGKASGAMAQTLENILEGYITEGIVNVPRGNQLKTKNVTLNEANHPSPDEAGARGAQKILDIAEKAEKNDLVICLISGGGSSLMPLPQGNISLTDKRQVTEMLLKSGAAIDEINVVRKHISRVKGGWLAKKCYPATVLSLIISDVVGDSLSSIASGPTVADSSTFSDARLILERYKLWQKVPLTIQTLIVEGEKGSVPETPKPNDTAFEKTRNIIIANNRHALDVARTCSMSLGMNTMLLTSTLEGEARHVGTVFSSIGKEIVESDNPVPKPAVIIAGGETTVQVLGKGIGGRNQEFALSAALKLSSIKPIVLACLSTDGIDGPTDAAGAIIDGNTLKRAKELGMNAIEYLMANDSNHFFKVLDDLIFTGLTGTNVNDIIALVVKP